MDDIGGLLSKIALIVVGFVVGVTTTFSKGWADEFYKKREEKRKDIKKFIGKVIDVIAIATSAGYGIRQNRVDRRKMDRAAFQLEKLGKRKLAQSIRSYMNKWSEVYKMTISDLSFKDGKLPLKEEEERRLGLIKELGNLTNSILKG